MSDKQNSNLEDLEVVENEQNIESTEPAQEVNEETSGGQEDFAEKMHLSDGESGEVQDAEAVSTDEASFEDKDASESEMSKDVEEDEEGLFAKEVIESEKEFFAEGADSEDTADEGEVEESQENLEFLEHDQVVSIVESILFATDKPQSLALIKHAFKGTQVKSKDIRKAIEELRVDYAGGRRGVTLEEVGGGYQLRTKYDNVEYLRRMVKGRSFKLSGPALETLAIIAYKQPCVKFHVDEVRGVESGHLVRSLMERGLVKFAGKSELPGKPMLYETTRKFLEIFGLRNIKELPSISEIDELIPEGIESADVKKETLDQLTDKMSKEAGETYSESEEELQSITEQLGDITTSSDFFEQEKQRMKDKRDADRANDIRDALVVGEEVDEKDKKWLERYERQQAEKVAAEVVASESELSEVDFVESDVDSSQSVSVNESENVFKELLDQVESEDALQNLRVAGTAIEFQASSEAETLVQFIDEQPVEQDFLGQKQEDNLAGESVSADNVDASAIKSVGDVDFRKLEEDMKIFDEPMDEGDLNEDPSDPPVS